MKAKVGELEEEIREGFLRRLRKDKSIPSIILLITVSWMLKSMHVEILTYLSLKSPFTMTKSMYCMIYQNGTYTDS